MLQKDMYLNGGGGGSSIYVVTAEHGQSMLKIL